MENNNTNNNIHNTINNIQKPASLVIDEFKDNIAKVINESGLHISLIEMLLKEMYLEVRDQAEIVSAREKAEYNRLCMQAIGQDENKEQTN